MSTLDAIAVVWFAVAWAGYSAFVDRSRFGKRSLTAEMNVHRQTWMRVMAARDLRMIDTAIMTGLQQGTAFFASASLIAIGGGLSLFNAGDIVAGLAESLPFGIEVTPLQWELKVVALTLIFIYAFFKFAWSYRLFNYTSILIGATPMTGKGAPGETEAIVARAAAMSVVAGRHFNRGMRSLFFALALLGWFVSAWAFMAATAWVLFVVSRRQFASDSLAAVTGTPNPPG